MSDNGSAPPADTKPKAEGGDNTLNIKITSSNHDEVFFKIKKTTKLTKLKSAYADRVGSDINAIRLMFDGERIQDGDTAESLGLEEGDAIDVVLEQVGGC
ncbi:small ubiquitin-related modifier [Kockovaella imperatae]|uniref:Small ubiquitin-related modifier n=1 Tax=Kockovaella imperatae TaxID=4999 RepID=A0A1Y1UBN5_9TREE|nr:small ubiquitin-related modifier [Kockovaella imperatae]ORX35451.1 small ubiquitin-related modifier [Kockovaella imperatae]